MVLQKYLHIDISFAVVKNLELNDVFTDANPYLEPLDSLSQVELQSFRCCELIKEYVQKYIHFDIFSHLLRNVKLWA